MFNYEYFCGANVNIKISPNVTSSKENYFEKKQDLNIVGINYSINYNPQPIYGYSSAYYDAVLKGRELVQGTILVHSKYNEFFLKQLISNTETYERLLNKDRFINVDFQSMTDFDIRIEFGSEYQKTNSGIYIRNCFLISKGKSIQVSADALIEEYNFFSRELHSFEAKTKDIDDQKKRKAAAIRNAATKINQKNSSSKQQPNSKSGATSFLESFMKNTDFKIESEKTLPEERIAYYADNNQSYSLSLNKEISLFGSNKATGYSAPFYAGAERKDFSQKTKNARLLKNILNPQVRYGNESKDNQSYVKDRKALELLISSNIADNENLIDKTKQISGMLWSYINKLSNSSETISSFVKDEIDIEKEYEKYENYIYANKIKRIVDSFFDGNYSNNIGLCDNFFYESDENKPISIDTSLNEILYLNDLIFYKDISNLNEAIYLELKVKLYKNYYESLWGFTPLFVKG